MVLCAPYLEDALGDVCVGAEGSWDLRFLERAYPGRSRYSVPLKLLLCLLPHAVMIFFPGIVFTVTV